jgi:hypothetical protein
MQTIMNDANTPNVLNTPRTFLILTNAVPVVGVFFFGWDAFDVVFLYWLENVVIGVFTVLKIVMAAGSFADLADFGPMKWQRQRLPPETLAALEQSLANTKLPSAAKLFLVPFFIVHYGLFTLVHGMFIFFLLKMDWSHPSGGSPFELIRSVIDGSSWMLWLALGSLLAEHGRSFWVDYVGSGRYKTTSAVAQMFNPYGRIVVMHLAILAGGFLMVFLQLPRLMVVVLIALKIGFELRQARQAGASR